MAEDYSNLDYYADLYAALRKKRRDDARKVLLVRLAVPLLLIGALLIGYHMMSMRVRVPAKIDRAAMNGEAHFRAKEMTR